MRSRITKCRMDMVNVRVASCLVCCLVLMVILYHQYICALMHDSCSLQFNLLQSQYDDATLKDLRKVVPNIGHAIMWSYEVWSELDA